MNKISACVLLLLIGIGSSLQAKENAMVLIPGGQFTMGKDPEKPADFSPAHVLQVNAIYRDKFEVTNREYLRFCNKSAYKLPEFWKRSH